MKGAFPEKWIEGETALERPSVVAVRTLQNRLGAVLQLLSLAAEKAEEDTEYVHELRVRTRRATAALSLYEDLMPRRRFSWMKKQLKRVRRAANDARDCDVLIERLKTGSGSMTKARMVGELGEEGLLLPSLVNEALAANDRAKYLMTLLQVAHEHADHPDLAASDLKQERLACGVADALLDYVVARSSK
jgi:CHAD domain-containing protein